MFRPTLCLFGLLILAIGMMYTEGIAAETPKFGEVSDEEWAEGAPEQCPDAKAIILFDNGSWNQQKGTLHRHVRIKILSKEGSEDVAEVEIPIYDGTKLKDLKAHTITPDGKKIEVEESFDKQVDQTDVKAFTFPAIEDGCIIEYQYKMSSYYYSTWYFQNDIFTRRSIYSVKFNEWFLFEPIYINIPIQLRKIIDEKLTDPELSKSFFTMELENLTPAKEEPLMGARWDNLMSIRFVIKEYLGEYRGYDFEPGWNEIGEWVTEWYESEVHNSLKQIKELSDSICSGLEDTDQRIEHLYNYVDEEIVTDNDLDPAGKLTDVLELKKGRSYEKNVLLVELLKAREIPAKPLMIGTRRDYGKIHPKIRTINQFNRTLCFLEQDETVYILDPGAKYSMYPYPESNDLAEQGLLLDGEDSRLMDIPHRERNNGTDAASTLYIDPEGNAVCTTTIIIKGYSIESWRKKQLDSLTVEKMVEDLLEDAEVEYEIVSADLKEDRETDRYLFDLVLELPEFASIIDGNFFFTPFLVPVEENPFVGDTRVFPVDFNFVFRNRHQIRVMLPDDMTVADVPRNIYQTMQEGKFTRKVIAEGNEIHIILDLDIKRASYPTMVYADIKEMFDIMSQSCMDQVLAVAAAVEAGGQ